MRVPHGWRRGWEKSRSPAATRTRSPVWDIPTRKCPGRERWMNFRRAADRPRSRTRRPRELRQAHGRRLQHRAVTFLGQTLDACAVAARGAGTRFYRGALVERNSFLPEMVFGYRARRET